MVADWANFDCILDGLHRPRAICAFRPFRGARCTRHRRRGMRIARVGPLMKRQMRDGQGSPPDTVAALPWRAAKANARTMQDGGAYGSGVAAQADAEGPHAPAGGSAIL